MLEEYVTGPQNKNYEVRTSSATAQGDVIASTEVKVAFDRDEAKFNFNINGNYLSGTSDTNTSAAMANAVTWETTQPFESSDLKTNLYALMVRLNSVHDKDVFEYNVDSVTRSITFFQRDGGELNIGGFVTPESHKDMVATVTPVTGDQGETTTLKFMNQVKQLFATATNGTQGIATSATLNLEGDDLYGFTMSDGTQSFTLNPSVVDISNTTSTSKFVEAVEDALLGSNIKVSMDTDGNVFFSDAMMVGKLSFNPLPLQLEKPVVGLQEVVKETPWLLMEKDAVPLTVNLTSNSTGSSNYSPVSGGGSQAIARYPLLLKTELQLR